jgi:ankyrin repeat protein
VFCVSASDEQSFGTVPVPVRWIQFTPPTLGNHNPIVFVIYKAQRHSSERYVHYFYSTTICLPLREYGSTESVSLLVSKGADVHAKTKKGSTPLHLVSKSCRTETVSFLVNKGGDVNAKNNEGSWTPLHMAYNYDRTETSSFLVGK